jgi:hypothetical protein
MRSSTIVGTALTLSGISTGDFFVVYDSNIGTSTTSLSSKDDSGSTIAIGTSFVDNVYQVISVSSVTSTILGIGTTVVSRVNVTVTGMGITNSGIITTSTYFGNYSWGKINLTSRSENNEFTFYGNNGVSGITTSAIVNRSESLKYKNYLT